MPFSELQWVVKLSEEWDVLGPFPIHAREQHFIEPSFPIDVRASVDLNASYPSAYADGGRVRWSKAQADHDSGVLEVSFPDSVRWKALRDTEGWAALQHHAVLKTSLTVYPASGFDSKSPPRYLRVHLVGGSYFTIVSPAPTKKVTRWFSGNIYDMERALPSVVELPEVPSLEKPTTYDIYVSGDYEVRLFGDPRVQRNSETPVQTIRLQIAFDNTGNEQVVWEPAKDITPDIVSGWTFGDAVGIGLRARDGWWSICDARIANPLKKYLSLNVPQNKFRLAPTQTRVLPLSIVQHDDLPPAITSINVTLVLQKDYPGVKFKHNPADRMSLEITLPINHLPMWEEPSLNSPSSNPVIKGSYFFGVLNSIPTNFLVIPPKLSGEARAPILALHGAGVDILTPTPLESFWAQSLPRQNRSWVVIPSGRTSWGLDWHGPSAQDALGVLDAVKVILQHSKSSVWGKNKWGLPSVDPPKAIVMGHSNGGQGAWYIAEKFPDRVLGVIPASAYIKSQSYVPWTMSRSAHFADPFLEAILQTALTPDNNDLFLSNLHGMDVLALHGGDDENVPVWHSRELVGVLQSLRGDSNRSRAEFLEFLNQPHWFPSVLNNEQVQLFIDQTLDTLELDSKLTIDLETFTLTVAVPSESGSMRGWHVERLFVPGRLGRVEVSVGRKSLRSSLIVRIDVETTNILEFSVDPNVFGTIERDVEIWIDGKKAYLDKNILEAADIIYFRAVERRIWKHNSDSRNTLQLSGRMQTILSSPNSANSPQTMRPAPLVFVIPDPVSEPVSETAEMLPHAMSVALRLSHDLLLYHQLDSEIMIHPEAYLALSKPGYASALDNGNVVVVGNEAASGLKAALQNEKLNFTLFSVDELLAKVHEVTLEPNGPHLQPGQGILFLRPHPTNSLAKMLLLQSTDPSGAGLERAMRLFPIRTGVPVPDWIIVGDDDGRGEGNVVATGLWDSEWNWNSAMSWSATS